MRNARSATAEWTFGQRGRSKPVNRRRPGRLARGLGRAAVDEEMALVVGGRGQPRTVS